ncbi:hypothetical protein Tco_1321070 [Tanacetum coccineum]
MTSSCSSMSFALCKRLSSPHLLLPSEFDELVLEIYVAFDWEDSPTLTISATSLVTALLFLEKTVLSLSGRTAQSGLHEGVLYDLRGTPRSWSGGFPKAKDSMLFFMSVFSWFCISEKVFSSMVK